MATRKQSRGSGRGKLATGLGIFSIGLGLAEVVAPRRMARLIGVVDDDSAPRILRGFGVREAANGVAILIQPRSSRWLWARVGGDALDLAFLGRGLSSDDNDRGRTVAAVVAVAGVTATDVLAARSVNKSGSGKSGIEVRQAVTVNRPADELYRYWRNFENLPHFMEHLESVHTTGTGRSHWKAKGPAGTTVEWDAEIVEDRPGEVISWRSLDNSEVGNSGSVRFTPAPGGRGTEVLVQLTYTPPGGAAGAAVAKLLGEEPQTQTYDDMHRFKQVMETGEVVRSEASPAGTSIKQQMAQRPGQPAPAR